MIGSFGINLAVPSAALLGSGDAGKLALESASWMHLTRYLNNIVSIPAGFDSGSAATDAALQQLRSQAALFGSPRDLRQLVLERPDILSVEPPPSQLYAAIVWQAQRLHDSAAAVVSFLKGRAGSAGQGAVVREGLQLLGSTAEKARNPIAPLIAAVKSFKGAIISDHNALAEACKGDADNLHRLQEALGGLQVRVERMQKDIQELGILHPLKKRDLEAQLHAQQLELKESSVRAEKLREALGAVEPILDEGYWVDSGVNDLVNFLEQLRKVWTALGTGVAQLAVDALETQLQDPVWLGNVLGLDQAVKQWTAVDQAAKRFVVDAMVDPSND